MSALLLAVSLLVAPARGAAPPGPATRPDEPAAPGDPPPALAVEASIVLRVEDRERAARAAVTAAEEAGGWMAAWEDDRVVLRVPLAALASVSARIETLGRVSRREHAATDLSAELADLAARHEALRGMMERYEAVLAEADPGSVVTVEREILALVEHIEVVEGRRRALRHRADHARLEVALAFPHHALPDRPPLSGFGWMDAIDLALLWSDLAAGRRPPPCRCTFEFPPGFAPLPPERRPLALTPDGVVLRARRFRRVPEAPDGFWQEALRTRLVEAGYALVAEEALETTHGGGFVLELAAPGPEGEDAWLVGVLPGNREVLVLEAAGPAQAVEGRRAAVLAAFASAR